MGERVSVCLYVYLYVYMCTYVSMCTGAMMYMGVNDRPSLAIHQSTDTPRTKITAQLLKRCQLRVQTLVGGLTLIIVFTALRDARNGGGGSGGCRRSIYAAVASNVCWHGVVVVQSQHVLLRGRKEVRCQSSKTSQKARISTHTRQ